jgi:molecular chaperone GrpE
MLNSENNEFEAPTPSMPEMTDSASIDECKKKDPAESIPNTPLAEPDVFTVKKVQSDNAPEKQIKIDSIAAVPDSDTIKYLEKLEHLIASLNDKMGSLENHFTSSLKYDASKDLIINQLHKELQIYKDDLLAKIYEPLLKELICLYDDFEKVLTIIKSNRSNLPEDKNIELLEGFKQNIIISLEKCDVVYFNSDSPQFDPKTQRVVRVVITNDIAQNKQIADRIRTGFRRNEHIIRPEDVEVYKYQPLPLPAVSTSENSDVQKKN